MTISFAKLHEFSHRNRRRLATVAVAIFACWIAYVAVWGANGMVIYRQKRAEYRELQRRIEMMQRENQRLAQENKGLKTDPASIEREAREQLHYARPGDVVYMQPEAQPQPQPPATAQNAH